VRLQSCVLVSSEENATLLAGGSAQSPGGDGTYRVASGASLPYTDSSAEAAGSSGTS